MLCFYQKASSLWACRWNLEWHWRWHSWYPLWRDSLWSSWWPTSSWRETELSRSLRNHFINISLDLYLTFMYKSPWQIISIFVLIITNYIPDVGGCYHQKKEDAPRQFSPTGHRKGINYNLILENIYLSLWHTFVTVGVFP